MRTALRCTLAAGAVLSASGLAVPAPLKPRVVVTGLGTVSGCGIGQEAFWASCVAGTSSVGTVTHFDPEAYQCQIGSEVRDEDQNFVPADYFKSPKSVKSNDRATHFAVAASQLAVEDAGLVVTDANAPRIGVMVGSAFGGMQTFETQCAKLIKSGPKRVSPFTIPALLGNTHAGVIGIEVGAKGPNFSAISACATGSHCLGLALQSLQSGETDVMLAGGCEAAITPLSYAGFGNMKALASTFNDAPTKGSRPFDNDRAGFVMGEGAGVLVLETEAHALARGAEIYCEFVGYGASCDAYHITTPAPGGEGLARAISAAMGMAGLDGAELDYYNAHGTSTAYVGGGRVVALRCVALRCCCC